MKTQNILIVGILSIIGASVFYYLKNKKTIGFSNEKTISDKITEGVKNVSQATKDIVENKIADLKKEEAIVTTIDKKEAENFLKAVALSNQIKALLNQIIRPRMPAESHGRYDLEVFVRDRKIKQLKNDINNLGYNYLENGEIIKKT